MITVYMITAPAMQPTRVFLPSSQWGQAVREKFAQTGHIVSVCADQTHYPDPRDTAEKLRMSALLSATGL